jgi:threonyl-tRNA synthetase
MCAQEQEKDQVFKIRHSLAHLLAIEILKFDPEAKLSIGPVIDNGFYYDVDFSEGKTPTDKDLKTFQKGIKKITNKDLTFEKEVVDADKAREMFADNPYKTELIEELVAENAEISVYHTGDFVDLCSGPHVENVSEIPADAFEITSVAGAYWRGDENNKMLTRIYGVAFENKDDLDKYKDMMEKAKERDHRKIGKEMGLWTFSDKVGAGLPMFTPKGQAVRDAIIDKLWSASKKYGFEKVHIPHITKIDLYETSGHADKFKDEFFYVKGAQSDGDFVLKPMNCPHHTQIYAGYPKSYRDLPVRYFESTIQYRDEKPGELLGLGRVRSITIDDGHTFCTPEQIKEEAKNIVKVIKEFYESLDMWKKGETFWVSLSVRDPNNLDKFLGGDDIWDMSEKYLQEVSDEMDLDAIRKEGEAAFYGPKLDFMFNDALGREWQLATIQLDFNMPKRFELEYTDQDGEKKMPIMIHRAIAGSLERFLSVLIEHFAGNFPFWLAPTQVKVLPVAEPHLEKAQELVSELKSRDIRVEIDDSSDGFGKKVRKAKVEKVPYFVVIGDKEIESGEFTLESRDDGQIGSFKIEDLIENLK